MKRDLLSSDIHIKLARHYPPQELFDILKENLEEKFGTIIIKKESYLGEVIFVQGLDGYVNKIVSGKKRLSFAKKK